MADYEEVDELVEFDLGDVEKAITIQIFDDDVWEPDEDFFIQLCDPVSGAGLAGYDTRCKVTIIDDDQGDHQRRHNDGNLEAGGRFAMHLQAKDMNQSNQNPKFGFKCLAYSVMESASKLKLRI